MSERNTKKPDDVAKVLHDLKVSELRYRRLFETAQDGVLLINADTGMIEDVNPYLITMLGYTKQDFIEKYLWEIGVFKDIAASKENFLELQTKKYIRYENLPLETNTGEVINVEFVSNEYSVENTRVIQCNIRETTDRVRMALRQKAIILAIPDIVMEVDSNQIYTWANEPGYKFFGKDVIGKKAESYFRGKQETLETVQPLFQGSDEVVYLESWQKRCDGKVRLLAWWCKNLKDPNGKVIGALSTARDLTEQKKTEELLIKSEKYLRGTLDSTDDGILVVDNDQKVLNTNNRFKEMWRIPKELADTTDDNALLDYVLSQLTDPNQFVSKVRELYKSDKTDFDTLYFKDDRIFERYSTPLTIKKEIQGRVWSFRDVTDQRKAEKAVLESEEKNRSLIENLYDMIFLYDKDGIAIWNSPSVKQYGYAEKCTCGHHFSEIIMPVDNKRVSEAFEYVLSHPEAVIKLDAVKTHTMLNAEICIDMTLKYLPKVKGIEGIIMNAHDVTERENTRRVIMEENSKNQAILASIGDAVFACDPNGIIVLFNKVAEELTGVSSTEAIGKDYHQVISFVKESDLSPSNDFISQALITNKITEMSNHTMLVKKDGIKIPVADSAAPIKNYENKTIGCVVVFRDVTKERDVDRAKTEFVSLASHELRTPLATINWYSEMLQTKDIGDLNDTQMEYAQEIHTSSRRMVELVNALLNVSRLELGTFSINPKKLDITKVVKDCLEELKAQVLLKSLKVTENYPPQLPFISVDPDLITIILRNLLSNSVRYTPDQGKVTVAVNTDKESFIIKISDTGIGIPEQQKSNIFQKMFRADNAKKIDSAGTGLGLYTVREIIEHSGGKIWFESVEGEGTSFYITFPLAGMVKKEGTKKLV